MKIKKSAGMKHPNVHGSPVSSNYTEYTTGHVYGSPVTSKYTGFNNKTHKKNRQILTYRITLTSLVKREREELSATTSRFRRHTRESVRKSIKETEKNSNTTSERRIRQRTSLDDIGSSSSVESNK
jgi:hypothetical protein